jgi:hypothetical protein
LPIPYGLDVATEYSFRMCATDQKAPGGLCAQTRTFHTIRPDGDLVRGFFATQLSGVGHTGNVDAQSDPSGAHPSGELNLPGDPGNPFSGDVTCLAVHGAEAAVGAVGTRFDGTPASGLLKVRDLAPASDPDKARYTITAGATPPDCATATFGDLFTQAFSLFVVYDTP